MPDRRSLTRDELAQSYALCRRYARDSQSNFYYCFYLLPRPKRLAMYALYAFLRRVDDIGDEASSQDNNRLARLSALRSSLDAALGGRFEDPLFIGLADTVARFSIPIEYLYAVIKGVEMDLTGQTYETFADLEQYCDRVASVVGQACIHIWGFTDPRAIDLARQCGLAFQLTNILRDLSEDAARGRIYLPATDLRRFSYTAEELKRPVIDHRFLDLLHFEIERAECFYSAGAGLHEYLYADGQRIFAAMFRIYHRLLTKVRRRGGAPGSRVRLAAWEKLRTTAEAVLLPTRWWFSTANSGTIVP